MWPQIVVNFHTAYIDDNRLVLDKQQIRQYYLKRWFAIDAVGSFPGDLIAVFVGLAGGDSSADDGGGQGTSLAALQLLKIPKMLRIGRIVRRLVELEQDLVRAVVQR